VKPSKKKSHAVKPMSFKEAINRLGFDSWADNKIVNAIEDTPYLMHGEGNVTYEYEDVTVRLEWTPLGYTASLRAYTCDGWKETSKAFRK
jgi:hypothetical protein